MATLTTETNNRRETSSHKIIPEQRKIVQTEYYMGERIPNEIRLQSSMVVLTPFSSHHFALWGWGKIGKARHHDMMSSINRNVKWLVRPANSK